MQMIRRSPQVLAATRSALVALVVLGAPAGAEWLVLRDGVRLEIRGELRVETRRVVFTLRDGTLSTLPLAEVDLDATLAANRPPAAPATSQAASAREPIARFTDADFAHADDVARPTIRFYTTSWCPVCRRAREALSASGARYDEHDVDSDAVAERVWEELCPERLIPVIAFEDELLVGFHPSDFARIVAKWRAAEAAAEAVHAASRRPAESGGTDSP